MPKAVELTDEGLVRRMIDGEEEAFTLLYRRRQPAIYRFVLRMSGNQALAEDVTQEVFVALIRDAKRFDTSRGSFAAFLFGIARNHLHKRWEIDRRLVPSGLGNEEPSGRDQRESSVGVRFSHMIQAGNGNGKPSPNGSSPDAIPGVPEEFVSKETVERVRKAIASLPENYREAVVLCDLEEMSYEEAAVTLECPVGTVRSRLHRARAILLEKLEQAPLARRVPAVGE